MARQVKRYYEHRSRDQGRFRLADIEAARGAVEAALAPWFEQRKRTRKCEVFAYGDGDEVRILITHGGLFRADGNITDRLEFSRLPWRPQKHDSGSKPWHGVQESVINIQSHWVECLWEDRAPATSGRDNLSTFALVEAAYASAASGLPVRPEA